MARGEGEQQQPVRSRFVERVAQLPVVHSAWDYATHTYSQLKETSRVARFTLRNAERSVSFVAGQAGPVVRKFEKQIQVVDDFACKGLGTLEEKVPFIMKPTDEILGDTRKLYESTVNNRIEGFRRYGNDRVKSATDFGVRQATAIFGNRLVQSVLSSVDGALVVTQNYVDYFLPPTKEEKIQNGKKKEEDEVSSARRLARISSTVRRRAYKALLLKLEYAQERSMDFLIVYPFRMIEFSKSHLDAAVEFANKLWLAIRQVEHTETDSSKENSPFEEQVLALARIVSVQVSDVYSSVTTYLASTLQEQGVVATARDSALWLVGMLRLVPELLPMYIHGLATWINERRNRRNKPNEKVESYQQNGNVRKDQNGGIHNDHPKAPLEDSYSDHSIPEEDEDC